MTTEHNLDPADIIRGVKESLDLCEKALPLHTWNVVRGYFLHEIKRVRLFCEQQQVRTDAESTRRYDAVVKWQADNNHWNEHPAYNLEDWRSEVSNDDTRRGYFEWMRSQADLRDQENTFRCQNCEVLAPAEEFSPTDGDPAPCICPDCGSTQCFPSD